ncbi:MAG: hypothetical protein IJU76_15265, partial [Desulfovibrionaceae bacterium]|nr:hypothetical protein [Desulfovibrionaceae bacterium]
MKYCELSHSERLYVEGLRAIRNLELSVEEQILIEIIRAIKEKDKTFAASKLAATLYDIADECGAMSDLLSCIGSWGDTLPDQEV